MGNIGKRALFRRMVSDKVDRDVKIIHGLTELIQFKTKGGWVSLPYIKPGTKLISLYNNEITVKYKIPNQIERTYYVVIRGERGIEVCGNFELFVHWHYWRSCPLDKGYRNATVRTMIDGYTVTDSRGEGRLKHNYFRIMPIYPRMKDFYKGEPNLPIHPYNLGVVLGNGWCSDRKPVTFCTPYKDIVDRFISNLDTKVQSARVDYYKPGERYGIEFYYCYVNKGPVSEDKPNQYVEKYTSLGLKGKRSWEKFIPRLYLEETSLKQRIELLQGLMDTDGNVSTQLAMRYTTSSEQLAYDLRELIWSIGGYCHIRKDDKTYPGYERVRPTYFVQFNVSDPDRCVFTKKKLDRIKKVTKFKGDNKFGLIINDIIESPREMMNYSLILDKDEPLIMQNYIPTA
nr:MAG TPA: DNA recombination protein RecA [Caudoviricetes sp.]